MRIGELENKDMLAYHQKGKIEALKAAQKKATYLVEALGKKLGDVIRIVEEGCSNAFPFAQSNVLSSDAASFDNFRTYPGGLFFIKNKKKRPKVCLYHNKYVLLHSLNGTGFSAVG